MKKNQSRYNVRYNAPAYPNAADANYFSRKAYEILASIVSGMGVLAGMIFLVIMA